MTVNCFTVIFGQKIWLICCYPNMVSLALTWHTQPPIYRCLSGASVSDSCFRCQSTAIPLLSMDVHHKMGKDIPFGNIILSCYTTIFNIFLNIM